MPSVSVVFGVRCISSLFPVDLFLLFWSVAMYLRRGGKTLDNTVILSVTKDFVLFPPF
jgi:hypothetical protein